MAQATKAVEQARNAYKAGNYQVGVALLQPFVGPGARKLSSRIELDVVKWLSACHRGLGRLQGRLAARTALVGADDATAPTTLAAAC